MLMAVPVVVVVAETKVGADPYVNLSAGEGEDVPPGVVTVTSTVPAEPAGLVTVIDVALLTVIAPVTFAIVPNVTEVAPVNPVPVMVTDVPPERGPDAG